MKNMKKLKNMKKWLFLPLALCLSLALAACDGSSLSGLDGSGQTEIFSGIESVTENTAEAESVPDTTPESVAENTTEAESVTENVPETETITESVPDTTPESVTEPVPESVPETEDPAVSVTENGVYTTKEDVALYIHLYDRLPENFITKTQARDLGWPGGDLEPYAPGKCIGGDRFGNYEGLLPANHQYKECDINTLGAKKRGAERLIYSTDLSAGENLIYYTGDHYESFTLLYGVE